VRTTCDKTSEVTQMLDCAGIDRGENVRALRSRPISSFDGNVAQRMRGPRNDARSSRSAWRIAMPLSALCTLIGLVIDIAGLPRAIERDFAWLTAPGKPSDVTAWMLYIIAGILLVLAITSRDTTRR
jgi:hypothetical protein